MTLRMNFLNFRIVYFHKKKFLKFALVCKFSVFLKNKELVCMHFRRFASHLVGVKGKVSYDHEPPSGESTTTVHWVNYQLLAVMLQKYHMDS